MGKSCATCRHEPLPAYEGPCGSCSDWPPGSRKGSRWEPKEERGCTTCRHESLPAYETPCNSCCLNGSDLFGSRSASHWEPKSSEVDAEADAEAEDQPAEDTPAAQDWDGGGPVVETIEPYKFRGGIEPIEFIRSNRMGFIEGSIIKYLYRHPVAGGVEDLKKAMVYLTWLIEDVRQGNKSPAIGPEE